MSQIIFGNQKIEFERIPSRTKEIITIRVELPKKLSVFAATDVSEGEVTRIIKKKAPWIINKFERLDEIQHTENMKEFISGESILYKGKLLRLKVLLPNPASKDTISTDTTTIFCRTNKPENQSEIKKMVDAWYKQKAKEYLENRINTLSKKFYKKPNEARVRNQSLRWGSCTKTGEVLINWRIIMAPPSIIDYVLIHELTHLQEKNHTKQFWQTVKNAMPNYEEKKEWLRVNGPKLSI